MPLLFIHAINSEFQSRDEGAEYARPEDALASGVSSAVMIAGDEIAQGSQSAAVVVIVERPDGQAVLRSVVAVSVSPLSMSESRIIPFASPK